TFRNRIHRLTPRANPEVNRFWMCDAGRQSYASLYDRPRLETPIVSASPRPASGAGEESVPTAPNQDVEARWDQAFERAAALLRGGAAARGGKSLAAILSARLTVEDLYLARRVLVDLLGIERLAIPPHEEGEDDHLLLRRDKTPNARGAVALGLGPPSAGRV